jgi:hypothetical protein
VSRRRAGIEPMRKLQVHSMLTAHDKMLPNNTGQAPIPSLSALTAGQGPVWQRSAQLWAPQDSSLPQVEPQEGETWSQGRSG